MTGRQIERKKKHDEIRTSDAQLGQVVGYQVSQVAGQLRAIHPIASVNAAISSIWPTSIRGHVLPLSEEGTPGSVV
jgi:hypothetical protein